MVIRRSAIPRCADRFERPDQGASGLSKGGRCDSAHSSQRPKTGLAQMNHELLAEVLDGIFAEVGDCVTFTDSLYPVLNAEVDCIIGTERLLELGNGNKYV